MRVNQEVLEVSFIIECQSCGGPLREFLDLGHHPPTLGFIASPSKGPKTLYPLKALRCESCGLVQSSFATDPKILWGGEYFYTSGATASFKKYLEDFADRMMKELGTKFVLDIGSNDGTALREYHDAGVKVLGVEPSNIHELADRHGIPTLHKFFSEEVAEEIVDSHGKADLVTIFNVFAHIADLGSLMRGIDRVLEPGGVFLTESQYLLDVVPKLAYDTFYLEHMRYYSLRTVISLLGRYGFEVFDAERTPAIGGSIRIFAMKDNETVRESQRYGFTPPKESSVAELLKLEDETGLQDFQTYADFAERVKQSKVDLNALLWRLKKEGNRIVGIGAPGRSTTIINYCALGPDLIDYLVETSPLKIGKFSPGMEIPVTDEAQLLADQPEYAVNFLWHLPEMVPKLRAKGYKGKLIFPLPTVRVLD